MCLNNVLPQLAKSYWCWPIRVGWAKAPSVPTWLLALPHVVLVLGWLMPTYMGPTKVVFLVWLAPIPGSPTMAYNPYSTTPLPAHNPHVLAHSLFCCQVTTTLWSRAT